jgi:hypothetical protein
MCHAKYFYPSCCRIPAHQHAPSVADDVLGIEQFERCFPTIQKSYNQMLQSPEQAGAIVAVGKTCERWFKDPSGPRFARLVELFITLRSKVVPDSNPSCDRNL